jgi:hypothetical protein
LYVYLCFFVCCLEGLDDGVAFGEECGNDVVEIFGEDGLDVVREAAGEGSGDGKSNRGDAGGELLGDEIGEKWVVGDNGEGKSIGDDGGDVISSRVILWEIEVEMEWARFLEKSK